MERSGANRDSIVVFAGSLGLLQSHMLCGLSAFLFCLQRLSDKLKLTASESAAKLTAEREAQAALEQEKRALQRAVELEKELVEGKSLCNLVIVLHA